MSVEIRIRREQLTKARSLVANLGLILSGRQPDKLQIRDAFWGAFIHSLSQKIHTSYLKRSQGTADDLGNTWQPLDPATIKRRLSPSIQRKFPLAGEGLIMRLSDDLSRSLSPGTFDGFQYVPASNQKFEINSQGITFGSTLPYANRQNASRELIPDNIEPWIVESLDVAAAHIIPLIQLHLTSA